MPGITICQATPDDAATFVEIHEEVARWLWACGIQQWAPGTLSIQWVRDVIVRSEVYLACEDGTVIAAVMLQEADSKTWGEASLADAAGYIHGLRVRRSAAGRGIGRALMAWAEWAFVARGKRLVRLDCWAANAGLCAYYVQAGYRPAGTRTFTNGSEPFVAALFEKALGGE